MTRCGQSSAPSGARGPCNAAIQSNSFTISRTFSRTSLKRMSNVATKRQLTVLYGQAPDLSTSFQTRELTRFLSHSFAIDHLALPRALPIFTPPQKLHPPRPAPSDERFRLIRQ